MLRIPSHPDLKRIVLLNPKGGSGKSTLATNLAGYFAARGTPVALMDLDPQGSSMRWLSNRPDASPAIHGVAGFDHDSTVTRSWQMRIPRNIQHLIIDTPAAVQVHELTEYTRGAHAIFVPVLPSDIDIHAASRLIADLLVVAKVSRRMGRLGVIANRVRENTRGYRKLLTFLERLSLNVIGELRDSQNYVYCADQGIGVHELQPSRAKKDLKSWRPVCEWLLNRLATPLSARDLYRPEGSAPVRASHEYGGAMPAYAFSHRKD